MKKVLNLHNFRRLISRQSKIVTKMMKSIPSIWVYNKRQKLLHHTGCGPRSASILILLVWPCQLQSRLDLRLHQQANMRVNKHNPIANKTRNRNRFDTFKRGVFFPSRSSGTSHSSRKSCNDNLQCIPNPSHKYLVVLFPDSAAWKNGVFFLISLDSTQTKGHTGQTYCSSMTLFANRLSFVLRTVYSKKRDFVYFLLLILSYLHTQKNAKINHSVWT